MVYTTWMNSRLKVWAAMLQLTQVSYTCHITWYHGSPIHINPQSMHSIYSTAVYSSPWRHAWAHVKQCSMVLCLCLGLFNSKAEVNNQSNYSIEQTWKNKVICWRDDVICYSWYRCVTHATSLDFMVHNTPLTLKVEVIFPTKILYCNSWLWGSCTYGIHKKKLCLISV